MSFLKELKEEFKQGTSSQKLSIITNLLSVIIIGISALTIISKITLEKVLDKTLSLGNFFLGLYALTFLVGVFIIIIIFLFRTKKYFTKIICGLYFYYFVILLYVLLGLTILCPLSAMIIKDLMLK